MNKLTISAALATLALFPLAGPAAAQSAADYNRLNQAMQICGSPLGASVPECAQLRGQLGGGGAAGALGGLGNVLGGGLGGNLGKGLGGGLGGLLGGALGGQQQQQQQNFGGQQNAAAIQQAYVACVQRAGVNQAMLTACASAVQAQTGSLGFAPQAPQDPYVSNANGIAQSAAGYRQCVMANPSNVQSCMGLLNGGGGGSAQAPAAAPAPARPAAPFDPFAAR